MKNIKKERKIINHENIFNFFVIDNLTYRYENYSSDFPTLARSEFVFACMSSNASNRDFMAKCSCAIDEIAKRMTYKEYAQAEAIARLQYGASPREEAYKSVGLSKERMDKLYRAQAASELECF